MGERSQRYLYAPEDGIFHGIVLLLLLRQLEDLLRQPGDVVAVMLHRTCRTAVQIKVEEAPSLACFKQAFFKVFVPLLQLS